METPADRKKHMQYCIKCKHWVPDLEKHRRKRHPNEKIGDVR